MPPVFRITTLGARHPLPGILLAARYPISLRHRNSFRQRPLRTQCPPVMQLSISCPILFGLAALKFGWLAPLHAKTGVSRSLRRISIMAPPLLGPELKQPLPTRAWGNLFTTAMLNDLDYFRANDPFTLAEKNADALRDRTYIRIVAHSEDEHWLVPQCGKLHQILMRNQVPHEFCVFTNVKGHSPNACMDSLGDAAFSFFSSSLARSRGR
ncbi:MAG: hypothetical protein Q7S40_27035 [Opitutaceae bacterium]|nr:hypothetical protein [Opitutaceae bacterium]